MFLKDTDFPEFYWAPIPVYNPSADEHSEAMLPFFLPFEVLALLHSKNPTLIAEANKLPEDTPFKNDVSKFCDTRKLPQHATVVLGLHGDGVPHRKKGTVEALSWNMVALPEAERVLFTLIEKQFLCQCGCSGRHTLDAMLKVFVWSMQVLLSGEWPQERHDGKPWLPSDKSRRNREGSLGFHGLLGQARGDWAWYKQLFSFPSWASENICWRCAANKSDKDYKQVDLKASWRKARYSHRQFFILQAQQGLQPSPLFAAPFFTLAMVMVDVLHTMDLGVTQDCLGNLFWQACKFHFAGKTRQDRVSQLWKAIKEHYRVHKTSTQLQNLTLEMIKQDNKAPKLRAKGGETRGLVPFGFALACQMQEKTPCDSNENLVRMMAKLLDLYMVTSLPTWNPEVAERSCREFLVLYRYFNTLAETTGKDLWRLKPKIHLMQELFEYQGHQAGNPRNFWTYRDESFVGFLGTMAHPRGGKHTVASVPVACMNKYRALAK